MGKSSCFGCELKVIYSRWRPGYAFIQYGGQDDLRFECFIIFGGVLQVKLCCEDIEVCHRGAIEFVLHRRFLLKLVCFATRKRNLSRPALSHIKFGSSVLNYCTK